MKASNLAGVGLFVCCMSVTGAAQAEGQPEQVPAAQERTASVDEIVVTARRRAENIQNVPVAITALSAGDLKQSNVQSVYDLQYVAPSLNVRSGTDNDDVQFTIRGQGGYNPGAVPAVVVYSNEVPTTTAGQGGLFYDLQNVQVLKGPQGTLFGRNSTGGAILLESRRPGNVVDGYLEVTGGNYADREFEGALNIPLVNDKLLFRVAATGQRRDGYTQVLATPSHPNGLDLDDRNLWAARGTLTYRPVEGVQNHLIVDTFHSNTHGTSAILRYLNPSFVATTFPAVFPGTDFNAILARQNALGVRTQVPIDIDPMSQTQSWSATDLFTWELSENLSVRNIASAGQYRRDHRFDGDGTTLPVMDIGYRALAPFRVNQYTEEAQLQGRAFFAGKLDWVAGVFYLSAPQPSPYRFVENIFANQTDIASASGSVSKAVYAQGTYDLTGWVRNLKFTLGGRYSRDSVRGVINSFSGSGQFGAPSWNVSLDYAPAADTLVYLASRRGYRSGGINRDTTISDYMVFAPEYVTDAELGAKLERRIGGVRLRADAAVYHQNYTDIQIYQTLEIGGRPVAVTRNAASARVDGGEVSLRMNIDRYAEIGASYARTRFKYTGSQPGVDITTIANDNHEVPENTWSLSARVFVPTDAGIGDLSLGANWSWQSERRNSDDPVGTYPAYGLLNLSADWKQIAGSGVDVSVFVTNATDEVYPIGGFDISNYVGTSATTYGPPRMYGLRLGYHF